MVEKIPESLRAAIKAARGKPAPETIQNEMDVIAESGKILRAREEKEKQEIERKKKESRPRKMKDGSFYAGISPNTKKPFYVLPDDAPDLKDFNAAARYAEEISRKTGKKHRLPTPAELRVIFNNRMLIGHFHMRIESDKSHYYWASTPNKPAITEGLNFATGLMTVNYRHRPLSVRLVRDS